MSDYLLPVEELKANFYKYYGAIFIIIIATAILFQYFDENSTLMQAVKIIFVLALLYIQMLLLSLIYTTAREMNKSPIIMCIGHLVFHIFFAFYFVSTYRSHVEKNI